MAYETPDDPPIALPEALAQEIQALRPGLSLRADADIHLQIHQLEQPLSGLCISGGGIRSATFALGALQGLAEKGILQQFDYLSTVSGGGYIGSWLTAWKHRAGGLANVIPALRADSLAAPVPAGADPIHHLREYNNYLSPKLGAFSPDAWTLVATVLRNVLLNWMVLIPMMLLVLLVPRYVVGVLALPELLYGYVICKTGEPDYSAPELDAISSSDWVDIGLPLISALLFGLAMFNTLRYLPGLGNRDHSRSDYRRYILAPLILGVLTFLMYDSLYFLGSKFTNQSNVSPVLLWSIVPAFCAWLLYLILCGSSFRDRLRLFFSPLSFAVVAMAAGTGFAAWISTNFLLWSPNPNLQTSWAEYVTIGPSLVLLGFCFGTTIFLGLLSSFLKDADREWMSRAIAGVLIFAFLWTGICFLVLVVPRWVLEWHPAMQGGVGVFGALAGWFSSRGEGAEGERASPAWTTKIVGLLRQNAPLIFIIVLIVALSLFTNLILKGLHLGLHETFTDPHGELIELDRGHDQTLIRTQPVVLLILTLGLAFYSWLIARFVNVNTFSLHGMYRDRLVRAYLGASNPARKASLFTGFAADDDIPIAQLDPSQKPLHVVNLTLNMVAAKRLDWQQRKATSFTATAIACGNSELGYRPSRDYAGGITLGTAVAISGAAASPNMGSNTSSVLAFILTLFNARLGAWLGNTGPAGDKSWKHEGPRASIGPLLAEALAQTTDSSDYIYLSDGGHFENLALYEMVRRRVRTIVVLDSGADPELTYVDLGNALRKIRIDMKIPIELSESSMRLLREQKCRCAVGRIRYSVIDGACEDGRLIYIKPLMTGNEPPDVASYQRANPSFPHQTTADQFFDESQTESYRMLGRHTVLEIFQRTHATSIERLPEELEATYLAAT